MTEVIVKVVAGITYFIIISLFCIRNIPKDTNAMIVKEETINLVPNNRICSNDSSNQIKCCIILFK